MNLHSICDVLPYGPEAHGCVAAGDLELRDCRDDTLAEVRDMGPSSVH